MLNFSFGSNYVFSLVNTLIFFYLFWFIESVFIMLNFVFGSNYILILLKFI